MRTPRLILIALIDEIRARRGAVLGLSLVVLIVGVITAWTMPLQMLPEIQYPQVRVIGDLPGQSSLVVEESVNEPLEEALGTVPGIRRMESRSGDGRAYIDLFFDSDVDLAVAMNEVRQRVEQTTSLLPSGYRPPRVVPVSTLDAPAMRLAAVSDVLSPAEIRARLRTTLLPRLGALDGVRAVHIGREETRELVIDVDPRRQAALNVSLESIQAAVDDQTRPPVSGSLRATGFEGVGVYGETRWSVDDLRGAPLASEGDERLTLGDVARVHEDASESRLHTRLDGRDAVEIAIERGARAHTLRLAAAVHSVVDELTSSGSLRDVDLVFVQDDAPLVTGAVVSVATAAAGGALLAILLLIVTMRSRGGHLLAILLLTAVSLAASVLALSLIGETLNLLTMAALLLSVGLGLDYAIIYHDRLDQLRDGRDRSGSADDASEAMADVAGPLFGALLTTLVAVLPFLLVEGLVARLFAPLIWTVALSAVISFACAFVILPSFSGASRPAEGEKRSRADRDHGRNLARIRALQHPVLALVVAIAIGIGLYVGFATLPAEVLPQVDDGYVELRVTHPQGISSADLDILSRRLEERLLDLEGTSHVFSIVGGYFRMGLPSFRPGTINYGVRLDLNRPGVSSEEWSDRAREAILDEGPPGLSISVTMPRIRGVQTSLSDADLLVVLSREDDDILRLDEDARRVVEVLSEVTGLDDVDPVRSGVSPRWSLSPRLDRMAHLGVESSSLRTSVAYAFEGLVPRQRVVSGEPMQLRVRFDRREAGSPDRLRDLPVLTSHGYVVSLEHVAEFRFVEEPTHIERRDGGRVVRVGAQLRADAPSAIDVSAAVESALSESELSSDVSWWLEGEIEAIEETRRTFLFAIGLALMSVFTILLIQYGSVGRVVATVISIPLCGVGAVVLLLLANQAVDAMVLAGLLIGIGIVANNAILILTEASRAPRPEGAHPGRLGADALAEAARVRLRPILLTVASTSLGMSPLLFGSGEVYGLLRPLAWSVIGTLVMSVVIVCFVLPGLIRLIRG